MKHITPFTQPIFVTKPFLPPFDYFSNSLKKIWENHWLTNRGPFLEAFESSLKTNLQVNNLCLFTNGTLALQIGLQGMGISGEVITTPFSFVATTHALFWNKIRPIFCDIDPDFYTIDPNKIENLITPWTTAILAVHVFGNPCQHDKLAAIAKRHNLKLIYDAAHAFGVKIRGKSIGSYGDLSMFSFHATKLFHSIEGGMLVYDDKGFNEIFNYLKNFGFKNETEVVMPGTNAKMNEFQAVMGLAVLNYIDEIIKKKMVIYKKYKELLTDIPGIKIRPDYDKIIQPNYSYMPVEISEEYGCSRDELYELLKYYNVFSRRYFYPLITDYSCYKNLSLQDDLKVSRNVSKRILTLPTYYDLSIEDVKKICDIIYFIHKSKV